MRLVALHVCVSAALLVAGVAYANSQAGSHSTVSLSKPRHHGYAPGTWVGSVSDTVTATAAERRGLGIRFESLAGTHMKRRTRVGPACHSRCPLRFTGSITYNTARMPDGRDTVSERAVSAGGVLSPRRVWRTFVDHKRPTLRLSGQLAQVNNTVIDNSRTYGLAITARDVNGKIPTSGIAAIGVLVDGHGQGGVSRFKGCSFGASCPSSALATWIFAPSRYPAGKHTITIVAIDSAKNAVKANVDVTVAPRMFWGATLGNQFGGQPPSDWGALSQFANLDAGGKVPSLLTLGADFYSSAHCTSGSPYPSGHYCEFPTGTFTSVRQRGLIPILSWASSDDGNTYDSGYTNSSIVNGSQDAYIRQWAKDAKAWGHPFFLRFDWEMNGGWWNFGTGAPSGGGSPRNSTASFVAMWRHVHDIFTQVGADNVTWVWCPNFDFRPEAQLSDVYPGNSYVDWTCIDGYNADNPWVSFHDRFADTYDQIAGSIAPSKPVLVGETASTAAGGSKSQWITDMFNDLPVSFPKIRGFLWYDVGDLGPGGRTDWPIEGPNVGSPDSASIAAFTAGISSLRYTTNGYSQLSTSPIPAPT